MEGQVLKVAEWELLRYTILDYVELFMNQGCLFESDELISSSGQVTSFASDKNRSSLGGVNAKSPAKNKGSSSNSRTQTCEYLRKYAEFFTDFCIQEECFLFVNPLYMACAIIAFARKYTKLVVIYPTELEALTYTSYTTVKALYQMLENRYTECFPDHSSGNANSSQINCSATHANSNSTQCNSTGKNTLGQKISPQTMTGHSHLHTNSSSKKTAYNSTSAYSIANNLSKGKLLDVETPNKS